MTDESVAFASAVEQADLVRRRLVSPVELAELYLSRIETLNPAIGAFVTVAAEQALDAARRAEAAVSEGVELAPFHGVPISIKDLAPTAGIRTTYGCAAWSANVPTADSEVVARIRRAGFVILGKTVTPELGPVNVSEPPGYPPGRNPWDVTRSCGGSSGGAAAALIAGLCPISHGTDGGGSIRNPSAWCGVLGLKPSRGRISDAPAAQRFFAVNGPITRTAADAAALLDVMAGPAVGDAFWAPSPPTSFFAALSQDSERLRIGFNTGVNTAGSSLVSPVDSAYASAVTDAAALLEDLGHVVEEVEFPVLEGGESTMIADLAVLMAVEMAARADMPPFETLTPWSQGLIELGRQASGVDVTAAQERVIRACRGTVARFVDMDMLLCPTVAQPPPPVGKYTDLTFEKVMELWALTPYTGLWNTTGQPAVSVPWAIDARGLPVAVQLVGRPVDETRLLKVASQIEAVRSWATWRPPL